MSQTSGDNELAQQNSVSRSNPIKSSMLRPSALQSASSSTGIPKASLLRPAAFHVGSTTADDASTTTSSSATSSSNPFLAMGSASPDIENEAKPKQTENGGSETEEKSRNGIQKSNLFAAAKSSITTSADNGGFVFGQNVHERVTGESLQNECTSSQSNNCSSSQLFAIAGSSRSDDAIYEPPVDGGSSVSSLNEVARVYEESRAQKRKYEEVETFTGEEDEVNVLDINSKLFAFVASNWEERGPGNLRVNDSKDNNKSSRVVFRTSGNLRVLLNTKIWPGMVVERPSQKSLRLTAIDSEGQVKIFLVMARPEVMANLFTQLQKRINIEKLRAATRISAPISDSAGISTTTIVDDDDDDEDDKYIQHRKVEAGDHVDDTDSNDVDSSIPNKKVALDGSANSSSSIIAESDSANDNISTTAIADASDSTNDD